MVFDSLTFVLFFAAVLLLNRLPLAWRWRKVQLVLLSYAFYAAWNPPFVVLIWISTVIDWLAARGIARSDGRGRRRLLLLLSLATNLGLLGFFKYGGFLLENFHWLMERVGVSFTPAAPDIVLPVGISFYTFQTMSYTLDVYRRSAKPWPSFTDFALYVTFFPQLVAGPIVRSGDFLPQCAEPRRVSGRQLGLGAALMVVGLFFKTVAADWMLAPVADQVFAPGADAGFAAAWWGTLAFSGQIYFDFAGYSTVAIGAALCLGFRIPVNFRSPYAATGFSDFWRRWHVSLSSWLRDYLYIPLGGNRRGRARMLANLMLTMLLGGLWHGASWHFVIWGGLHGLYLAIERALRTRWPGWADPESLPRRLLVTAVTYALVCLAWVFFRAPDFETALALARTMITGAGGSLEIDGVSLRLAITATVAMLAGHQLMRERSFEDSARALPWWVRSVLLAAMIIAIVTSPGDGRAFIYFQF